MEIFAIGDRVSIRIEPGCPQEYRAHGIAPLMNGLVGMVVGVESDHANGHCYRVLLLGHRMWFAPSELAPWKSANPVTKMG